MTIKHQLQCDSLIINILQPVVHDYFVICSLCESDLKETKLNENEKPLYEYL